MVKMKIMIDIKIMYAKIKETRINISGKVDEYLKYWKAMGFHQ